MIEKNFKVRVIHSGLEPDEVVLKLRLFCEPFSELANTIRKEFGRSMDRDSMDEWQITCSAAKEESMEQRIVDTVVGAGKEAGYDMVSV